MGRTVTLRPNGTPAKGGVWYAEPGEYFDHSTVHTYLADNNDGSYYYGLTFNTYAHVDFGTYTLAGNERCAGMRPVVRVRAGSSAPYNTMDSDFWLKPTVGGDSPGYHIGGAWPDSFFQYVYGGWTWAEQLQAGINGVMMGIRENYTQYPLDWSEAYIESWIQTQPTVAITSPSTDQALFSQQPTIYWNYNNQGDTVMGWRMKIFTNAVVTGGGFDPNSSSTVSDSGDQGGAANQSTIGVPLSLGGTYWAYVQIATDFLGTWYRSAWSAVRFIINTPPVVSAVTTNPATPITITQRPAITFTYTDANGEASSDVQVKIFSEAVYTAGGFNVDSSTFAWDSGDVGATIASGAAGSVTPTINLSPNINYKAYVRAAEGGSGIRWGNWAASGVFTITMAPGLVTDIPAVPEILSAIPDNTNQRVILNVQARDNMMTRNQASGDTGTIGLENDANAVLTRDTATFLQGGASWKATPSVNGTTMVVRSARNASSQQVFPVVVGRVYTALASLRSASTTRVATVGIRWYTAAFGLISTSTGANINSISANFTGAFVTAAAPATAVWAEIIETITTPSEAHYIDNISFAPGSSVVWTRGGFALNLGAIQDTFGRADSAVSMGTPDTGAAWSALAGTWGLSLAQAYLVTGAATSSNFVQSVSKYLSDGVIQADITLSAVRANAGLAFHIIDVSNNLRVMLSKTASTDTITLQKRVAGTPTNLAQVTGAGLALGATYTLKVEFFGGQINVYVGGTIRISYPMLSGELNQFGAGAGYGLSVDYDASSATFDNGGSRFDNFIARLLPTQTITIQRSLDGGVTWTNLRSAIAQPLNDQLGIFYDYEVPSLTIARYRMKATGAEIASFDSAWSTVALQSAQIVNTSWWLKDPVDPTLNMVINVIPPFVFRRKEPQQVYDPMGRKTSVVVTDGQKGIDGAINIRTMNKTDYDKLAAILANGRTLMISDILGRSWFVKFGDSQQYEFKLASPTPTDAAPIRHFHEISMPFSEVAAP